MIKNPVGFTVKFNRINQKISGRKLSRLVGVDHAVLIKIEEGSREANPYEQKKLFKELGITFRENRIFVSEAEKQFNSLYRSIVFQDNDIETKYRSFVKHCDEYREAEIILISSLMQFIYSITFNKCDDKYENYLSIVSNNISYLNNDYQSLFHDYLGIFYHNLSDYVNSLLHFKQAEELVEDDLAYSMICYHRATTLAANNDILTSMMEFNKSIDLFTACLNFKRILQSKMSIATLYSKEGRVSHALEILNEIIDKADKIQMSSTFIGRVYRNLAWCKMIQHHYDEAIVYTNKSLYYTDFDNNAYFSLIWCYTQKEDFNMAKEIIKQVFAYPDSTKNELLLLYTVVADKIMENKSLLSIHFAYQQLIENLYNIKDYDTMKFVLFDAVFFFEKRNYKYVSLYQDIMFNYFKMLSNN